MNIKQCLDDDSIPEVQDDCEYCQYALRYSTVLSV
jgi:hypothetical protein